MKAVRIWCYDEGGQYFQYVDVEEAEKLEAEIERLKKLLHDATDEGGLLGTEY